MSTRRRFRAVNGVILLDKPAGATSNGALQEVKRLYRAAKAGHTGSLDPLATGMLPICLGVATKLSGILLDAAKAYQVTARLGIKTTTGDSEGEVLSERPIPTLDETLVEQALAPFRGEIQQIPPMYSALKHQGERLYNLARRGIEVERQPRTVHIERLELVQGGDSEHLVLEVDCSKGTYVRTLIEDIGELLGCGAHVVALRRTRVGPYREEINGLVTMDELNRLDASAEESIDSVIQPLDSALQHLPAITLPKDLAFFVAQGQPVIVPKAPTEGQVRLYAEGGELIGIGEIADDGRVAPKRLLGAQNRS